MLRSYPLSSRANQAIPLAPAARATYISARNCAGVGSARPALNQWACRITQTGLPPVISCAEPISRAIRINGDVGPQMQ